MRSFKIILFTILINIPFFKSSEIIKDDINDIYVSKAFSESESIDILHKLNENITSFNYTLSDINNVFDTRNSTIVVIMDDKNILKTFCSSLFETTKITAQEIGTSENVVLEFLLLKTTFVMNEYKKNIIKLLKNLFKDKLSLIININECNTSMRILCESPKKIRIKNDLIKAYSDFINNQLKSEKRYNAITEMCNDKCICDDIINIMITQFISNLIYSSLALFPTQKSEDINTIVYTRTPLTKNSEKIEDKKIIEYINELMK